MIKTNKQIYNRWRSGKSICLPMQEMQEPRVQFQS